MTRGEELTAIGLHEHAIMLRRSVAMTMAQSHLSA